jgi:prepilin-type processing-associated H-X9-DG protein
MSRFTRLILGLNSSLMLQVVTVGALMHPAVRTAALFMARMVRHSGRLSFFFVDGNIGPTSNG